MECLICLEEYTKKDIIICPYCNTQICKRCVKEYLINYGGLECMNCKKKINITFIANYYTKKWLKEEYPKQYGKFCLLSEESILNNLMDVINIYNILSESKKNGILYIISNYLYIQNILNILNETNQIEILLNKKYNLEDILYNLNNYITNKFYGYYSLDTLKQLCIFLPSLYNILNNNNNNTKKLITLENLYDDFNIDKEYPIKKISLFDILIIFNENYNNYIKQYTDKSLVNNIIDNKELLINIDENININNITFMGIINKLIYTTKLTNNINKFYREITNNKEKDIKTILKYYNIIQKELNVSSYINKKCINPKCRGYLKEDKTEISKEEYDIHNNKKEKDIEDYRYISKSIKERNKESYITKYYKLNNLSCKLCNIKICCDCYKELNENHKCAEDDLANVSAIRLGAKSCPGCGIPIFKSEGCDHMFCINCHCMFNWSDLKITKTTTNPLYYEWLRSRGITPPRSDQAEYNQRMGYCDNNIYNSYDLINDIKKYNIIKYDNRYYNISYILENIHNYPSHTIDEYNKIRIKYLLNLLNEEEYKGIISKYDIELYYITEYNDIYTTFRFNLNDILHDLFTQIRNNKDKNNIENIIKSHSDIIDNFIKDYNINMNNYKKLTILNRTIYLIDNNWFIYENINHYDKTILKFKNNIYLKIIAYLINAYIQLDNYENNIYDYRNKFNYLDNYYISNKSINIFQENYKNINDYKKIIDNIIDDAKIINYDKYKSKYNIQYNYRRFINNFINKLKDDILKLNNDKVKNIFMNMNNLILEISNKDTYYNIDKTNYKENYVKLYFNYLIDFINELK